MKTNVFGCWYDPGDVGTWLTWFINQHKDFPKFDKAIRYEQEGNKFGNIPSDYSCFNSDWHVTDWADNKVAKFNDVEAFKEYKNINIFDSEEPIENILMLSPRILVVQSTTTYNALESNKEIYI